MEKMLVTQGLNELKTLDSRIYKAISSAEFISAAKLSDEKVNPTKTKEKFIKDAKASLDSIKDLIERREKIKAAIIESNAKTFVDVCGEKMSVAKAIDTKEAIEYHRQLLSTMMSQLAKAKSTVEIKNKEMESKVDKLIETAIGKESKTNIKQEDYDAIAKPYRAANEYAVVDPCNVETLIAKEDEYIDQFLSTVDQILQVSNCITTIEI